MCNVLSKCFFTRPTHNLISNYCTLYVSVEYDDVSMIDIFKLAVLLLKHLQCVSRLITPKDDLEDLEKKNCQLKVMDWLGSN